MWKRSGGGRRCIVGICAEEGEYNPKGGKGWDGGVVDTREVLQGCEGTSSGGWTTDGMFCLAGTPRSII